MSLSLDPTCWERQVKARLAKLPKRRLPRAARRLLRNAQQGDVQAFGELYDISIDVVFRYLYYGSGDEPTAKLLAYTTYNGARIRVLEPDSEKDNPILWLLQLAREELEQQFDGPFRMRVTSRDAPDESDMVVALAKIHPIQQECVVLRYILQLSDAHTAAVTKHTVRETRTLLIRAHQALADCMELLEEG